MSVDWLTQAVPLPPAIKLPVSPFIVLRLIAGDESQLYTPKLFVPPEAVAVTFVIVGEEEEL